MARKIKGLEVVLEEVRWGCEWEMGGEVFITEADDEQQARMHAVVMDGKPVIQEVYTTAWALAPDD